MKVIDLHCDTIAMIHRAKMEGKNITLRQNEMMIDLEKLKKGDSLVQTFAAFLYLKASPNPLQTVLQLIDEFKQQMKENADLIRPVYSYQDILDNQADGLMSGLLSIEEGQACLADPAVLRMLYELGVRMMTLTWNFENDLAYPNCAIVASEHSFTNAPDPSKPETVHGVKEKGLVILSEMEKLGMIIDVSHLSDAGFWDVYNHTTKPFIASHSNARAVTPHPRNLTDEMIKALGNRGGISGLNYCTAFLKEPSQGEVPFGSMAMMARHVRYMTNLGGEDFVALGSDFDGIEKAPEFKNAAGLGMLADYLKKEGFTENQVEKVFYKNALRVFKEILK